MNKRLRAFSLGFITGVLSTNYLVPEENRERCPEFNLGFVFGCLCYNQQLTEPYINAIKNAGQLANFYDLNLQVMLKYACLWADLSFIKFFLKGYFYQEGVLS